MKAGVALVSLALAAVTPSSAHALEAPDAQPRNCAASLLSPTDSASDSSAWSAPSQGYVSARLAGGAVGDWDLAAFRDGEAVGASTSFGSDERVDLWVERGEHLVFQGCRRSDGPERLPLRIDFEAIRNPAADNAPVQLVRVPIAGDGDLERFERMGLDVTHDVSATSATLALYSQRQRTRLHRLGFATETLDDDLQETDAAARASEAQAAKRRGASGLPSGRETYREYVDYTNDMKALAEDHPTIVREFTIGNTLEGRPIQGVEIAGDVNETGDGRPAYVQVGVHHAREWPSGELPMEFAIDLVEGYGTDSRITHLLDRARVFVIPVVNVDGFLASRSYGTSATDDDAGATGGLSINDQAAYKRKNCRPTVPAQAGLPCAMRTKSGVDLNRNYGAYWGGPGSSSDVTSQSYRGTAPYSEPEAAALREFFDHIHPTVLVANHTFTDDGKWLRQPGFDAPFLPQDSIGAVTPDEVAMKELGDDMAAATGYTSERSYETLGDITGATEDWNYFAQGTYGYTPEARGLNFHANYADSVVEEYVGDPQHQGDGMREAYLVAGERAISRADHSVIRGSAPATATLRLHKEFETPLHPNQGSDAHIDDVLDSTLDVAPSGDYTWDVNPSGRPFHEGETYTMSCELPGEDPVSMEVFAARGDKATADWGPACQADGGSGPVRCHGEVATIVGSKGRDRGKNALLGTNKVDVFQARGGDDVVRAVGGDDIVCGGAGADTLDGGAGDDLLRGGPGKDVCPGSKPSERKSCSG